MKTKLTKLMFALFAVMVGTSVNAQTSGTCGDGGDGNPATDAVTWELNGSQLIFSGTGAIKTYSTNQPTDYPWFSHMNNIQTVIIGEGITNIPDWAFAMYENLRSIHLPSTLKNIGNSCLEETNLWNVSLPEGLETIGHYAFFMCPFQSLCLPSTVTSIGQAAFASCDALTSIGCYADTPPAFYDNTVFDDCSNIETVYVQSSKIDTYKAAAGWISFGDKIKSPAGYCGPDGNDEDGDDDVTKATWVFDMSTHTLTISGTKLGQYNRPWDSAGMGGSGGGFNPDNNVGYPCGIYHLVIEEDIAIIPAMEFYMNLAIVDVTLPSTVTSIGMGAFGECFALESFTVNATTPPTLGDDVFMDLTTIPTIYVPAGSVGAYKIAAGWSTYADKIVAQGGAPATTTTFTYTATNKITAFDHDGYFTGATGVASHEYADGVGTVVFNGVVTAIDNYTFYYDSRATSCMTGITIPESVKSFGNYSFKDCKVLSSVTFAGTPSLTTIGTAAFEDCKALTSIDLPESLTTLGAIQIVNDKTYYNNTIFWGAGLTSLVIPKNVVHIYGGAMVSNCPITSLTVDPANTTYDDRGSNAIFETATDKLVIGCVATTVPDGTKAIGREAFFAEEQPFALTLPESVTSIETRAFHFAHGLTSINIPDGVTTLYAETFPCQGLETLTLGSGLTLIEAGTFEGCTKLSDIYCYANPAALTWNMGEYDFKSEKGTLCHVADKAAWENAMPNAYVTFVGDLVAMRPATHAVEKGGVTANWSTYYNSTQNVVADANTEVYQVSLTGTALTLTKVDDRIINAGQGVVLKSTDANIVLLTSDTQSATSYATNSLTGTDTQISNPGNAYALGYANSILGFYKLSAGGTIKAHKAYLTYSGGGAPEFFDLDGNVTGIKAIDNGQLTIDDAVYDLQGRRVSKPTKGLYIVNGKKVIIK